MSETLFQGCNVCRVNFRFLLKAFPIFGEPFVTGDMWHAVYYVERDEPVARFAGIAIKRTFVAKVN
jgi:hypothetical protein